jgi:hypothetical protein
MAEGTWSLRASDDHELAWNGIALLGPVRLDRAEILFSRLASHHLGKAVVSERHRTSQESRLASLLIGAIEKLDV